MNNPLRSSPERVVYLDHAATTPLRPEVVEVMTEQLGQVGNANSLHGSGRRARRVVEESRERIAGAMNCRPSEILFTSGGTEADNLAVKGITWARAAADPRRRVVVSTAVEHHAVLDPLEWLTTQGEEVVLLPVDGEGRLDLAVADELLQRRADEIALVSVMWANNEVGTLQPVTELVTMAASRGLVVHTDAVQAVGAVPVDFAASGVDALTVTAHKLGGPIGVGALLLGREVAAAPLLHGGGQERQIRSGTLDTPAIAGFAVAVEQAIKEQAEHAERLAGLRDALVAGVLSEVPDARLNGAHAVRLPGHAHLSFPGCEGDSLLMLLDHAGIECSTGSACSAGVPQASHVLLAMGRDEPEARSSLRFTLGRTSTPSDVDAVVMAIAGVVARARAAAR